nr:TIGR03619 family F420-dependent LLM class oxidoreductase [uncultured Actinoplanes sp.]
MPIKLGVNLPQTTDYDLATDVTTFAKVAEDIGFDSLWAYERVLRPDDTSGPHGLYGIPDMAWPDVYANSTDALVTLAMAAAVTERVELGTGVLVAPLHLPVRLAKTMAALDAASNGRLIAGLGSGWSIDEFEATAPRPIAERGQALDEFLDVAEKVWGPDPVVFANERYRIAPSSINPKPARRIPLFLAGSNRTALSRVVRRGTGWLATGITPAQAGAVLADLPGTECIFQTGVPDTRENQIVEDIAALSEAGVHHVYVPLPYGVSSLKELIVAAERLHAGVRDAGL